jgi:CRISP-associated protein Cas1
LYVTEQGASLGKRGQTLVIRKGRQVIHEVHLFKIDQVVLMGNVSLTPAATAMLLAEGVDTVFMSIHGKYRGRLVSSFGKNITLRRTQFQKMAEEETRLTLARCYVQGKIHNCRVLMRRNNAGGRDSRIAKAVHQLRQMMRMTPEAMSAPEVMGFEGRSAAVYFGCFGRLIRVADFTFETRNRRPPKDPVNVLLSLGYTLLGNAVQTQVDIAGLDPFLGCLHEVEYGRPSLVLDLMEEFRPVLVDALVLTVINKRIIRCTDFYRPEETEPAAFDFAESERREGEYPIILTHTGMKKFIAQFEARMKQKVMHLPSGKRLDYRAIVLEQVRLLVRHLKGEARYAPYLTR